MTLSSDPWLNTMQLIVADQFARQVRRWAEDLGMSVPEFMSAHFVASNVGENNDGRAAVTWEYRS
jgi:hypothetical protein